MLEASIQTDGGCQAVKGFLCLLPADCVRVCVSLLRVGKLSVYFVTVRKCVQCKVHLYACIFNYVPSSVFALCRLSQEIIR